MRSCIFTMVLVISIGGCGSMGKKDEDTGAMRGVSSQQANEMEAKRSVFESSEDPPFTAQTRFAAGRLAESQGALPQAIKQYEEAIKLDAKHEQSWYRLGVLYAKIKQFPKAINAWEQYIKVTNGAAVAYSNLGFCHEVAGDRARAELAYRQGIDRDPANVPCRVNYGLMLARAGREYDAIQQLQAVLTPAEAHYNLGSVYEQLGRKDQARAQYKKALEINPEFWEAQTRLAQLK